MKLHTILLTTLLLFNLTNGAKILSVFNMASYSHYILGHRLLEELALRGHDVTMVSVYKSEKIKNYRQVHLEGVKEHFDALVKDDSDGGFLGARSIPMPVMALMINSFMIEFTELALNNTNFQNLLKENNQYDVIILEQFYNEALKGICHHYQAPCIAMSTTGSTLPTNDLVGNPTTPSYIADPQLNHSRKMSFIQRIINSLHYTLQQIIIKLYVYPQNNALMHRYFPNAPQLDELMSNTSLVFLNSHPSVNAPVPHTPNMIEIGGFHIKPAKKLPEDLQKYLDNSPEGVIFFSMGSNVKSKDIPEDKKKEILAAFSQMKQKILWKFEDDHIDNIPANIKISKWLPQQEILAHPNVKLFITHGGLLSVIESVYYAVPMIGIPIFADQAYNMNENVLNGIAVTIDYFELNEAVLLEAMNTVLNNKSYSENAETRSKLLRDQPLKPLDAAVYWTEYIAKHKGAQHMRSAALDLAWYQYLLLDVTLFIALAAIIFGVIYIKCLKITFYRFCVKKDKKPILKKKIQ